MLRRPLLLLSAMLLLLTIAGSSVASAETRKASGPVTVGEVNSSVTGAQVDVVAVLRAAAEQEIASLDMTSARRGRKVILTISLTKMETEQSSRSKSVTCVVSITLREAKGGTLLAILGGKARAEGAVSRSSDAEKGAIEAAVKGALARLPEAVR